MLYSFVKFIRRGAFLAPLIVQAKIDQNAVEPSVKARSAVKVLQIGEGLQKRILGQILGVLAVAREAKRTVLGLLFVTFHEFLERPAFALLR